MLATVIHCNSRNVIIVGVENVRNDERKPGLIALVFKREKERKLSTEGLISQQWSCTKQEKTKEEDAEWEEKLIGTQWKALPK